MEVARSIREDYLHQNAFDDIDTYTSLNKQYRMLRLILAYQTRGLAALEAGATLSSVLELPVREAIGRAKLIPEDGLSRFDQVEAELTAQIAALMDHTEEGGR